MMISFFSGIFFAVTPHSPLITDASVKETSLSSLELTQISNSINDRNLSQLSQSSIYIANNDLSIPIPIEPVPETQADFLGKPLRIKDPSILQIQTPANYRVLITKNRQGNVREYEFAIDSQEYKLVQETQEETQTPEPTGENTESSNDNDNNVAKFLYL